VVDEVLTSIAVDFEASRIYTCAIVMVMVMVMMTVIMSKMNLCEVTECCVAVLRYRDTRLQGVLWQNDQSCDSGSR
jgi:hypothetical protein